MMIKTILKFFIITLLFSCNSETEVITNTTNKILENGKHLKVSKTTRNTTHTGIITKHNYGTTSSFSYGFTINNKEVIWKKDSTEPKNIIFTKDTVYLKSLQKKTISYQSIIKDTITVTKHRDTIVPKFEAYIDNRYFYKMFGDDFWVDIVAERYNTIKTKYKVFDIPNDNEYQIKNQLKGLKEKRTLFIGY